MLHYKWESKLRKIATVRTNYKPYLIELFMRDGRISVNPILLLLG